MSHHSGKAKKGSLPGREQIGQILFCIAFAMNIAVIMSSHVKTDTLLIWKASLVRYYLRIGTCILLTVKFFFFQKTTWPRRLLALTLCALGYVTSLESATIYFYWLTLFIAAGKDVNIKNLAKTSLAVLVPGFILTIVCAQLGIVEMLIGARSSGAVRNAMGFVHYNTCGLYVFEICLSACAVRFGKRPTRELLLTGAGAVFCWFVPNSRTYTIAIVLLMFFVCLFYHVRPGSIQRVLTACMAIGTLFLVGFSYYCMLFYTDTNPVLAKLNTLFSTRLSLAHQFYTEYGLSLLGHDYSDAPIIHGNVRFLVDNTFCNIPLLYGAIAAVIFLLMIAAFYIDAVTGGRWTLCLMGMTLFMIIGFSESIAFRFCTNYFMIAASGILYGTREETDAVISTRKRNQIPRKT